MLLTTQSNQNDDALLSFIEETCGESHLRVESNLGDGFVRLRSSEAERRQAAQDIRCTEDIIIEMLRNARDAQARTIFLSVQRDSNRRIVTVIDDGCGIPQSMHELIFDPRVTSKLDTAHMDKWGMHGRGMALYSVRVNAQKAYVASSAPGLGSAIRIETNLDSLSEKTDQSSFPVFETREDGTHAMRGPRNILRMTAEFTLEHRKSCTVYCGTPAEICATLYGRGMATTTPTFRAFATNPSEIPLASRLAVACDSTQFACIAQNMGLDISERTARRIMDGAIKPIPCILERMQAESFKSHSEVRKNLKRQCGHRPMKRLSEEDTELLQQKISEAYAELARRYYLHDCCQPDIKLQGDSIKISIPIAPNELS